MRYLSSSNFVLRIAHDNRAGKTRNRQSRRGRDDLRHRPVGEWFMDKLGQYLFEDSDGRQATLMDQDD